MSVRIFTLLFFVLSFGLSSYVSAQVCGRSENQIVLSFDEGVDPPSIVNYALFYVTPKVENIYQRSMDEVRLFVARFYYGELAEDKGWFWHTKRDGKLLSVSVDSAEKYLENYKNEDFKAFYESGDTGYFPGHSKQLQGVFENGRLTLQTSEMDETAFLMKVSAKGFETQYLLSNFLGGCRNHHQESEAAMKLKTRP